MTANETQVGGSRYQKSVQPWDAMRSWFTSEEFDGFLIGNAIKYLMRWREKNGIEDVEKARHYLTKFVETHSVDLKRDSSTVRSVVEAFRGVLQSDRDLAWSWHCNLAVVFQDQGGSHEQSNRAASRFMLSAFGVDVTVFDQWLAFPWVSGKWEVVCCPDQDGIGFYRVRWSVPDEEGRYLWIRHYAYDETSEHKDRVTGGWASNAANRNAEELNRLGRRPEEFEGLARS